MKYAFFKYGWLLGMLISNPYICPYQNNFVFCLCNLSLMYPNFLCYNYFDRFSLYRGATFSFTPIGPSICPWRFNRFKSPENVEND